jgi:hypothetical protein
VGLGGWVSDTALTRNVVDPVWAVVRIGRRDDVERAARDQIRDIRVCGPTV